MGRRIVALASLALVAATGCATAPRPQLLSGGMSGDAQARHASADARQSPAPAGSASLTRVPDTPLTDSSNAPGLAYSLDGGACYLQRGSDGTVRGRVTMAMPGGGVGPRLLAKMINTTLGTEIDIDIMNAEVGGEALLTTSGAGSVVVRGHPTPTRTLEDSGGGAVPDDHPLLTTPYLITITQRDARPHASVWRRDLRPTADEYAASIRGDYPVPRVGRDARRLTTRQAKLWVNLIAYAINVSGRGLVHAASEAAGPEGGDAGTPTYLRTLRTTPHVQGR